MMELEVDIGGVPFLLTVRFVVTYRGHDPSDDDPGGPMEVDVTSVVWPDGTEFRLPASAEDAINRWIVENYVDERERS
jgi:hypothetical protein